MLPRTNESRTHGATCLLAFGVLVSCLVVCPLVGCQRNDSIAQSSHAAAQPSTSANEEKAEANLEVPLQTVVEDSVDAARQGSWEIQFATVVAGEAQTLSVEGRPVAAAELAQLPAIAEQLEQLLIESGGVSDAGIEHIARLPSLRHLRIRNSVLTDDSLEVLAAGSLSSLQILNIPQASISSRGIRALRMLPQLRQLRIGGRLLDDDAAEQLARLPNLRQLHVIGPGFTDQALDKLSAAPHLSSLYMDDCPLSDEAWERLFSAKPSLHVHIDQHHHDRDPNPQTH